MTQTSLARQIGGSHYKGMVLQPVEFSMLNRWDACAHSSLKYLSRYSNKYGALDLQKGGHFIEIRMELLPRVPVPLPALQIVPMQRYIDLNEIPPREGAILLNLEEWVLNPLATHMPANIINGIIDLIAVKYGAPE